MPSKDVRIQMDDMDQCLLLKDLDEILRLSVDRLDFDKFFNSLDKGASPNTIYQAANEQTVFQRVCQLPGAHKFIEVCIVNNDADVNQENKKLHKYPIHFVADSQDVENFKALIESSAGSINLNTKYDNKTAIYILCDKINDENHDKVSECIRYLLDQGADMNIPDNKQKTPIYILLKSKTLQKNKEKLLQTIFNSGVHIDLETYRDGEAKKLLKDKYPNMEMRKPSVSRENTVNTLIADLEKDDERIFLKNFLSYSTKNKGSDRSSELMELLHKAVMASRTASVKELISQKININEEIKGNTPISLACTRGYHEILKLLLDHPDIVIPPNDSLLCTIVKELGRPENKSKCNYYKCFELLLNCPKIDVNEMDKNKCSPLYYAVKYKNTEAVHKLLEHSAYIGTKDKFNDIAIHEISPEVLEKHFDSCVTTNEKRPGDEQYEIYIDFTSLVPPNARQLVDSKKSTIKEKFNREEMTPIEYIANTPELQHLLKHPVITCFLFLKWHQLRYIFFVNFSIFSVYFLSLITYIVFCYQTTNNAQLNRALWIMSLVGAAYVLIREIIQCILSPKWYFRSFANYVELILVGLTWTILCESDLQGSARRIISSTVILLAATEFSLLFGALPYLSISTHMAMLKRVTLNFLKSLALYSIYILAFAFTFYTLFRQDSEDIDAEAAVKPDDEESDFNKFHNPGSAIIKTIVMLTGEFEAASFDFNTNAMTYVVFVLFIFLISIVMLNLLNGLAVSDTQAIKMEAELIDLKERTHLLSKYESIVVGPDSKLKWFTSILAYLGLRENYTSLFPDLIPNNSIKFAPNDPKLLVVAKEKVIEKSPSTDSVEEGSRMIKKTNARESLNSSIDRKIIRYSKSVIEKTLRDRLAEQEKQDMNDRIKNIEAKLEILIGLIKGPSR